MLSSGVSPRITRRLVEENGSLTVTPPPAAIAPTLPPAEPPLARITAEGRLVFGKVSFPAEAVAASLQGAGKLVSAIKSYFNRSEDLDILFSDRAIVQPSAAGDPTAAVHVFRNLCCINDFRRSIYPWEVALGGSVKERTLQHEELMELRALLRQGAEIASACCVIDDVIAHRYLSRSVIHKSLDWLSRRSNPTVRAIETYLREQPFRYHDPHFLRIELDKWAQRIDLRNDGLPLVHAVCEQEAAARKILEAGPCTRVVSLTGGVIVSRLTVRDESTGGVILDSENRLPDLYSILLLAKAASKLLQSLEHKNVDLARLCSLSNRDSCVAISRCVKHIFPHTHNRIEEADSWATRFDVGESQVLSAADVAGLGEMLLDAEAVLSTLSHLQRALLGAGREALWRSKWTRATSDNEIRTALALVNEKPAPLECDCEEAAEAAASAALVLGYSSDERTGDLRAIPESPVQSIAWLLQG